MISNLTRAIKESEEIEAKATPGPFVTEYDGGVRCVNKSRRDPNWRDWIARTSRMPVVGQSDFNADFICHSLNELHKFRSALKIAVGALEVYQTQDATYDNDIMVDGSVAREALAKVEEVFK